MQKRHRKYIIFRDHSGKKLDYQMAVRQLDGIISLESLAALDIISRGVKK